MGIKYLIHKNSIGEHLLCERVDSDKDIREIVIIQILPILEVGDIITLKEEF